jgi:glycosyltransferase involved in cell wall biosynthesis
MKINFLVPEIVRSGGIRTVWEYSNRLTRLGHEVIVYTPMIPFNSYRPKYPVGIIKHQLKYALKQFTGKAFMPPNIYKSNFKIKAVPAVNNFVISDADAIVATSWTTAYHVTKLSAAKGKKFYLIQDFEVWNSNIERAENSYRLPLNRTVVSKYLHDLLKSKFNSDSTIISAGVNFEDFYNENKIYNEGNHPLEKPVIIFNDHLLEHKNVRGLLKALEMLKEKYPALVARCFGVSRYNEMPSYIDFHRNPDDKTLRELYCSSDIFLFASRYEGFGTPPAEAMACKCALVANAVAAIPEYSVHMESAIHCNPNDHTELFKGASYLIDNPAELKRISEAGFRSVRNLLSWDTAVEKFLKLI